MASLNTLEAREASVVQLFDFGSPAFFSDPYQVYVAGRSLGAAEAHAIGDALLAAYRWQYVVSGAQDPRFVEVMWKMVDARQRERISVAPARLAAAVH